MSKIQITPFGVLHREKVKFNFVTMPVLYGRKLYGGESVKSNQ